VSEAQERAAAERLSSGNYGNTMKGLKQELSDIKKVMQTTDLGDDKFQEMTQRANELTNKLKELEQAYGQFGRNVGNYKSAFDDIKKITVQVGSTAREFNSVRDASRQLTQELKAMVIAGKENTEEYNELAEAVHNFEMASRRAESAVNDLKASSQGMDDILDTLESFGALGQITEGFSALFGFDNSEIERSIQKLVALQNVMQGIEKIRQQMNTGEGIGKIFQGGNQAIDSFV
jgi:DNA repair exonuclease SbcCD ATPase subunit